MKLILSLAILLVSTASFANDRICLIQNGIYLADMNIEFFKDSTGYLGEQRWENITLGKTTCSKMYFPANGEYVSVKIKHMVFPTVYKDTCPEFKTNESVKIVISGMTLNYTCDVKKCEQVGCTELLEN